MTAEFGTTVAPQGFVRSEEVEAVAATVISDHDGRLGDLTDFRIAYLLNYDKVTSDETGVHAIAKAVKAPALWQALGGWDAAVWVQADAWKALAPRQRLAVVYHELLHFYVTEKGGLAIAKHDVEEFIAVASEYGPWHGGLDRLGEQLRAFDSRRP